MTTIRLRVRVPKSSAPQEITVDTEAPWFAFLYELESVSGIASEKIRVLSGFPPKPLDPSPDACVKDTGLRSNDTLIVQEGEARVQTAATTGKKYVPPASDKAHFTRRVCPSDNSCLFHACAYVLRDRSRSDGPLVRKQCVDHIRAHPEQFNEESLAMSNNQYATWLSRSDTWGGAVELQILSQLYEAEIYALDLESTSMQKFGTEEGHSVRAFIVYTGNHYDCIAMNPQYNSNEKDDQVLFNTRDVPVISRAQRFVQEEGAKLKAAKTAK